MKQRGKNKKGNIRLEFSLNKIEAIKILFFVYPACNAKDSLPAKWTKASVEEKITDDGYKTQEVTVTRRPATIFPYNSVMLNLMPPNLPFFGGWGGGKRAENNIKTKKN